MVTSITRRAPLKHRSWVWIALGSVLIVILADLQVTITDPRVHVRWDAGVSVADRATLESQHGLENGRPVDEAANTWRYELDDRSVGNIRALIQNPAVADTDYIDRDALTTEGATSLAVRLRWYPFSDLFDRPAQLFQLHRSLWLLLAGGGLLWASRAASERRRRNTTIAALLFVGLMAVALPLDPLFVTMGGARDHARSREDFESWFGGRVRYEKHLSQTLLLQVYRQLAPTEAAPEQALIVMSRGATAWFVLTAMAIGFLERWSPVALRYLGLALLAPSALLYFGWREFGYLSLSVAAFPLLARGLADGGTRLEAGSAVAGLGAALHGSGLVSLAGAGMAALGVPGPLQDRAGRALRVAVWGTAAYLGWIAFYVIVLKLPVTPDPGLGGFSSWRPWLVDEVRIGRVSAAILSPTGARDVLWTAWIIGAPLLVVALSLWRRHADELRAALWYLPPSLLFVVLRWPFEGIGGGMDLVVAGFPAFYALAWVCAQDSKRTNIAAVLLLSAHYAFWRVVLDQQFQNLRVD